MSNPDPVPTQDLNQDERSVAAWVARSLVARGVERAFGLQGGHIQPIWDFLARYGVQIVDVRHETAAVHMAHAHAELTGQLGVCLATAGPGVTNCVTGIANAHLARAPVLLIGGCPPRPQSNMGPLQDIAHAEILAPITNYSRTARVAEQAVRELDEAIARARGDVGEPGPSYIEFPTDVLRIPVADDLVLDEWMAPEPVRRLPPDPDGVAAAVEAIRAARRPLVISGRGATGAADAVVAFLDATGALYLDTQESRGLVPADHPAVVGAVRAAAMGQADLVITLGRKLDYQLGFGSPAVFGDARFLRIADTAGELIDNRRGRPEILASIDLALADLVDALGDEPGERDRDWADGLRTKHRDRIDAGATRRAPEIGDDGRVHPMAVFDAIRDVAEPDYIGIADGGDFLSFARIGLSTTTYLDAGAFGCLGIGVPFANAAALRRALANAPAVVDVVTSQTVVSSDATKGLGFVPDYQALTAWDEAEQKRRTG